MENSTYNRILNAAHKLAQTRGFNAFSYRDLANTIGIKTASIHYHFPVKDNLGTALIRRHRERLNNSLQEIIAGTADAKARIECYIELFLPAATHDAEIDLSAMFASDYRTLSDTMQHELREFFAEQEAWLADVLWQGKQSGVFKFAQQPHEIAQCFFAGIIGVQFAARLFPDEERAKHTRQCWQILLQK